MEMQRREDCNGDQFKVLQDRRDFKREDSKTPAKGHSRFKATKQASNGHYGTYGL
ncbi:hypothetical protein JVU11DRAFT_3848 [Chiua virens]|nr:hypothetical protein JVU11DRAFT_12214 [Chiua virens]KAG9314766.1 hypothetical protein JVU11DRAFT_3848 [Chiua virens]